ncbi:cytidine deaminase-like protein [Dipodascopsis tothii]|uniref:cytidine deaminase-like protein n=1 Tax=Dipodascopsis tothii TaxID=44089 RepID=UPI0034CDD94E
MSRRLARLTLHKRENLHNHDHARTMRSSAELKSAAGTERSQIDGTADGSMTARTIGAHAAGAGGAADGHIPFNHNRIHTHGSHNNHAPSSGSAAEAAGGKVARRAAGESEPAATGVAARFTQIKAHDEWMHELELLDVWVAVIPAKMASTILAHFKKELGEEPHSLNHLRRLAKRDEGDSALLTILICSVDAVPSEAEIRRVLQPMTEHALARAVQNPKLFVPEIIRAPRYAAPTKQLSKEWSEGTWPIMWRGNPQAVKMEMAESVAVAAEAHMQRVAELVARAGADGELPAATVIVDPATGKVVAETTDRRQTSGNPLFHSGMQCIALVAAGELARRARAETDPDAAPSAQAYLCHNLELYTSHEPCAMCCMAMVHSRVGRLVYARSMPRSGGIERTSGPGYGINWNKNLNWRFEAWRYDGLALATELSQDTNA